MTLAGKVALVIGGTEGVGLGIVEPLAGGGASFLATGRRQSAGEDAVARDPSRIMIHQTDAREIEQVREPSTKRWRAKVGSTSW